MTRFDEPTNSLERAGKSLRAAGDSRMGEALILAALDRHSLPAPWSVRDGIQRSQSWIGWQDEDERLDVARCLLESRSHSGDRVSDIYLRHATTLMVHESAARGGVSERQYVIGVPAHEVRRAG